MLEWDIRLSPLGDVVEGVAVGFLAQVPGRGRRVGAAWRRRLRFVADHACSSGARTRGGRRMKTSPTPSTRTSPVVSHPASPTANVKSPASLRPATRVLTPRRHSDEHHDADADTPGTRSHATGARVVPPSCRTTLGHRSTEVPNESPSDRAETHFRHVEMFRTAPTVPAEVVCAGCGHHPALGRAPRFVRRRTPQRSPLRAPQGHAHQRSVDRCSPATGPSTLRVGSSSTTSR